MSFAAYVSGRLPALNRAARRLCGDRPAADDLVQATLIKVAPHWARVAAAGDPDPYVRRVMLTEHVSAWRRGRHRDRPTADLADPVTPDPADRVATALAVRTALARLAPGQRTVLVLRYFDDLTTTATARIMRCSVSTVKSQTRDALAALRAGAPELAELARR